MQKSQDKLIMDILCSMKAAVRRAFIDDDGDPVPDSPRSEWRDTDVAMGPWPESMQEAHHQAQNALEEILDAVYESTGHHPDGDDTPEAIKAIVTGAYDSAWETGKSMLTAAMAQMHSTLLQQNLSRASTKHTSGAEQKCTTREVIGQRKCPRQLFGRGVTEAGWQQAGRE